MEETDEHTREAGMGLAAVFADLAGGLLLLLSGRLRGGRCLLGGLFNVFYVLSAARAIAVFVEGGVTESRNSQLLCNNFTANGTVFTL